MRAAVLWSVAVLLLAAALCLCPESAVDDRVAGATAASVDLPSTPPPPPQFVGPRAVIVAPSSAKSYLPSKTADGPRAPIQVQRASVASAGGLDAPPQLRAIPLLI